VADLAADLAAALEGDPPGGGPGGDAPWLKHHDSPRAGQPRVEYRRRNARGLARPGRRLEHEIRAAAQFVNHLREDRVDRERSERQEKEDRRWRIEDRNHDQKQAHGRCPVGAVNFGLRISNFGFGALLSTTRWCETDSTVDHHLRRIDGLEFAL